MIAIFSMEKKLIKKRALNHIYIWLLVLYTSNSYDKIAYFPGENRKYFPSVRAQSASCSDLFGSRTQRADHIWKWKMSIKDKFTFAKPNVLWSQLAYRDIFTISFSSNLTDHRSHILCIELSCLRRLSGRLHHACLTGVFTQSL